MRKEELDKQRRVIVRKIIEKQKKYRLRKDDGRKMGVVVVWGLIFLVMVISVLAITVSHKKSPDNKTQVMQFELIQSANVEKQIEPIKVYQASSADDTDKTHPNNLTIREQAIENVRQLEKSGHFKVNVALTAMEYYYAKAIWANYYFVRDNIIYVLQNAKTAQTDLETLRLGAGKCDEQAFLLVSLLRSIGLEADVIRLPNINHAIAGVTFEGMEKIWEVVTINGKNYLLMDTTCKTCELGRIPDTDKGQDMEVISR